MRKKYLMASWKENHIFSENIKLLTIYIGGLATHESSHNISSTVSSTEQNSELSLGIAFQRRSHLTFSMGLKKRIWSRGKDDPWAISRLIRETIRDYFAFLPFFRTLYSQVTYKWLMYKTTKALSHLPHPNTPPLNRAQSSNKKKISFSHR